jgi:small subunit ribosomal protein S4
MGRQLIVHGHVRVDGRKVDVPSFIVEPGQSISVDATAQKMPDVQWASDSPVTATPQWLRHDGFEIQVVDFPDRKDVDLPIEENLIVEFYSR